MPSKINFKNKSIGILSPIMNDANVEPFFNLVDVISGRWKNVFVLYVYKEELARSFDKNLQINNILYQNGDNILQRLIFYILTQINIFNYIFKKSKNTDCWFYYINDSSLLPIIAAKIRNNNVVIVMGGDIKKEAKFRKLNLYGFLYYFLIPLRLINLSISNNIILYSKNLIDEWNLKKYKNKILIARKHFIDLNKFKISTEFNERDEIIGFIGRLSSEKGIINFVKSIPKILEHRKVKFIIIGKGPLKSEIQKILKKIDADLIEFIDWVPNNQLPNYLNKIKLLVIPSFTEGLPNIMIEAMACGTIILANPVGSIVDIIKNGQNGFIMKNNSIDSIYKNILKVLEQSNLNQVSKNSRKFVEKEFSYEAASNNYNKIFLDIFKKGK